MKRKGWHIPPGMGYDSIDLLTGIGYEETIHMGRLLSVNAGCGLFGYGGSRRNTPRFAGGL